jgi:hypothetical protein
MGWLSMLMNGGATIAHTICRLSSVMAIFATTACLTWSARAETISGRVRPMDGDTFEIAGVVIRLADVDAPEMSQKCQGGPKELRNCGAFVADHQPLGIADRAVGPLLPAEAAIRPHDLMLVSVAVGALPNRLDMLEGGGARRLRDELDEGAANELVAAAAQIAAVGAAGIPA